MSAGSGNGRLAAPVGQVLSADDFIADIRPQIRNGQDDCIFVVTCDDQRQWIGMVRRREALRYFAKSGVRNVDGDVPLGRGKYPNPFLFKHLQGSSSVNLGWFCVARSGAGVVYCRAHDSDSADPVFHVPEIPLFPIPR